jgi:positive phototaxis protein PixI
MENLFDSQLIADEAEPLTPDPPPDTRRRLLRFSWGSQDSAFASLEQITEVFKIESSTIVPVPDMPDCVLGLCNWRGEMLWLLDFAALFKELSEPASSLFVLVVQERQQSVGLVVSQVRDIELHDLHELHPAVVHLFPPRLLPFISAILPQGGDPVVDVHAIVRSRPWQSNSGLTVAKTGLTVAKTGLVQNQYF